MKSIYAKKILVMISVYNGEKHLREQIDSILDQKTNHDIHIRIRDDGSRDECDKMIDDYIARYPGKIEIIKGENIGYNASFFALLKKAGGYDYYAFSDQDDVWLEDKIQIACDAIDEVEEGTMPVLYASTSYLVHDDLVPYGVTRKREKDMGIYNTIIQNICPGHTQVFNNRLLELLKDNIDTSKIYVYDSWVLNVANLYGVVLFDNNPHTYYRQYAGNSLGYGSGWIGRLITSVKRIKTNDGIKYRRQIEYFMEKYMDELKKRGYFDELDRFTSADSFFERLMYWKCGRLYRQKKIETIFFYVAVVLGKF